MRQNTKKFELKDVLIIQESSILVPGKTIIVEKNIISRFNVKKISYLIKQSIVNDSSIPRSFINDGVEGESHGLIGNPDGVGWHVITPFQVDGGEKDGEYILINRGWVQDRIQSPTKRHNAQIEGVVEINGVQKIWCSTSMLFLDEYEL